MAPMGPGTYGSQKGRPKKKKRAPSTRPTKSKGPVIKGVKNAAQAAGVVGPLTADVGKGIKKATGQLRMNMQKMPPKVQKRLMDAMKRKKQGMR